jgi:predicted transcriptional regulator
LSESTAAKAEIVELTAEIASAFVSNNRIAPNELPLLIQSIYGALSTSDVAPAPAEPVRRDPAVSIKKSITDDYLICLEDGRRFKSLKRHLRTKYNLSPEDYRAKWDLPKTYPMVAPAYAAARSNLAKEMGLGQGGRGAKKIATPTPVAVAKRRGRPKGAAKVLETVG